MASRLGLRFRSHACRRCGGDAYLDVSDDQEWRCLQCSRIVPHLAVATGRPEAGPARLAA